MDKEIKHFTDLDAWRVNHELALMVYKITKKFPKDERFGLIDQMRKAASSITANIAEGWGRYHYADKIKFFYQARGSNCEVQNFVDLSNDLKYLDKTDYEELKKKAFQGFKVINGLIRSTEKQKSKF
jgi:four helix bundle protein